LHEAVTLTITNRIQAGRPHINLSSSLTPSGGGWALNIYTNRRHYSFSSSFSYDSLGK